LKSHIIVANVLTIIDLVTATYTDPTDVDASLDVYEQALGATGAISQNGHIFLQHDTIKMTAESLAAKAIDYADGLGFQIVTVGTCLGFSSASQWYRS
jgi:hypothetical protein